MRFRERSSTPSLRSRYPRAPHLGGSLALAGRLAPAAIAIDNRRVNPLHSWFVVQEIWFDDRWWKTWNRVSKELGLKQARCWNQSNFQLFLAENGDIQVFTFGNCIRCFCLMISMCDFLWRICMKFWAIQNFQYCGLWYFGDHDWT